MRTDLKRHGLMGQLVSCWLWVSFMQPVQCLTNRFSLPLNNPHSGISSFSKLQMMSTSTHRGCMETNIVSRERILPSTRHRKEERRWGARHLRCASSASSFRPSLSTCYTTPGKNMDICSSKVVLSAVRSVNEEKQSEMSPSTISYAPTLEPGNDSNKAQKSEIYDSSQFASFVSSSLGRLPKFDENQPLPSPLPSLKFGNTSLSLLDTFLSQNYDAKDGVQDKLIASMQTMTTTSSRRQLMGSVLMATGLALGMSPSYAETPVVADAPLSSKSTLRWEVSPVNKRSGVTVFDAEQIGYNVNFVTYLSRFLINFDADCRRWWYSRAADIPRTADADKVDSLRLRQFAAFSASVEVGLQEYNGPDGPQRLLRALLARYCPDAETLAKSRGSDSSSSESSSRRVRREIKEARRQIALLFGLMDNRQPVEEITKVLAAVDNATVVEVEIVDGGSGYAPGYGPPLVTFSPPGAGEEYDTAYGRAVLKPTGRLLRVDVVNRGMGYNKPPAVTISPPGGALSTTWWSTEPAPTDPYRAATAKATVFRDGPNKGKIQRLELVDPGRGYTEGERIRIQIAPPEVRGSDRGITATAEAILEYKVGSITIVEPGNGYAAEKPIPVYVEPPPLTARINMNDPILVGLFLSKQQNSLSSTTTTTTTTTSETNAWGRSNAVKSKAEAEAGVGGGGGCVGRACYDKPVVARAYARSSVDSYISFRNDDDRTRFENVERALKRRSAISDWNDVDSDLANEDDGTTDKLKKDEAIVSGTTSGAENLDPKPLPFWGIRDTSSTQLLSLLPSGVGLLYNTTLKRYVVTASETFANGTFIGSEQEQFSTKPFDPYFGPRGRSPIERDRQLGLSTYLRFAASGAICSSGAHLTLTPIDVVKTKIQTDPQTYPNAVVAFQKVVATGPGTFFTGWAPTFLGFFVWGGFAYTATEFFRRYLTILAGENAASLEVPILFFGAAVAAACGSVIISPFETVRIRSVAQPDYADNIGGVLSRLLKEEGFGALFTAVPAFLLKEVPFACAKFVVFDLTTAKLYELFPAAREDLQLSLLFSVIGGVIGGIVAAVASNPADATISAMKKAKTDMSPLEAASNLLKKGGVPALFTGLGVRMFFYSLLVSLQFFVYDAVRFSLGVATDDLKLYLDVLGGALKASGGPAAS